MGQWQETYRVPASITLHGGTSIEGDIHLQSATVFHSSREVPVEMLNRPERFFAVSLPTGDVALVCKAQAAVVTYDGSGWEIDEQRRAISRQFRLDIDLIGGLKFVGEAFWELPPTSPRPQDFLNVDQAFFEITEGGMAHCINRALVTKVRPFE